MERIIQERCNKTNIIDFIEEQAQKILEYDWKEYNIHIFKQWKLKMMKQYTQIDIFDDNSELNKNSNLQNILSTDFFFG